MRYLHIAHTSIFKNEEQKGTNAEKYSRCMENTGRALVLGARTLEIGGPAPPFTSVGWRIGSDSVSEWGKRRLYPILQDPLNGSGYIREAKYGISPRRYEHFPPKQPKHFGRALRVDHGRRRETM